MPAVWKFRATRIEHNTRIQGVNSVKLHNNVHVVSTDKLTQEHQVKYQSQFSILDLFWLISTCIIVEMCLKGIPACCLVCLYTVILLIILPHKTLTYLASHIPHVLRTVV